MSILNILRYPDARLHKMAAPVTVFDSALKKLADDLAETMYAAPGVGLAASQVDVHKQVIVVDVDGPTDQHGIPPNLLFCEFQAVGFRLVEFVRRPELNGYYAQFEAIGPRPEPSKIKPCNTAKGKTETQ